MLLFFQFLMTGRAARVWPRAWLCVLLGAWAVTATAAEPWTLERAIAQALTNSPDARIAQQRIQEAQAGLMQANAAFWPQVQFQSSYMRTDNPINVFGSILNERSFSPALLNSLNNVPEADDLNARGAVTVPLYAGGKNTARRHAAQANAQATRLDAEAVRNNLAFEVARAFHTVHKARAFIRAAEASVTSYEGNVKMAQKRFDAGTLLRTEVLDMEVRLAQAREDLVRARNAERLAVRSLRNLLGIETGDFDVADTAPKVTPPQSNDFSARPELAASKQQQQAAAAEVRQAKGGYQPELAAFSDLDYDHGWRFNGSGQSWTAGLRLRWDLWDGQLTRGKVREARAKLESAQESERKLRLAIDLEAERARLSLQDATERLTVTDKAVSQAAESVTLTRDRFAQGLAISTQLIDAETALTGARVRRAEAEADQQIAIAAWRKALGLPQLEAARLP